MTAVHMEVNLEAEIVRELCKRGWVEGTPDGYDKDLALYREDVIGWLQDTQFDEYAKVQKINNGSTEQLLLERLAKTIDEEGPLAILRKGFKRTSARFDMCVFKPSSGLNAETNAMHSKVRCRVVRQVRYSKEHGNSIDLVLFINGIPVATLELKTEMTQTVQDAINQYRTNRLPKDPKTNRVEPLLTAKRGALVHFAVSDEEVYMTTELAGSKTHFLPFNLGYAEGAGNPPNPNGAKTAYLWERILERETWLDIIDRFIHIEKSERDVGGKKQKFERIIFPRYHQWDVVTKLLEDAKEHGAGQKRLIQHSAGSGKSNSIMWLAHRLSTLHDDADNKIFDSIIVVTDRNVLDKQLQDNIFQYEHKSGVVKRISGDGDSKSGQLQKALDDQTPVIIVTIQTFPALMARIDKSKIAKDRKYAIIADEAHSSQTGDAAKKLKSALGMSDEEPELDDDPSNEDLMLQDAAKRAGSKNISYFAFTATPKPRTMELFGTRDPVTGEWEPFHLYSMQQAIEEGFILDVLQNYVTFDFAWHLANDEKYQDVNVPKSKTAQILANMAREHDASIAQRVQIIVEHFRTTVRDLLDGKAKAMVVTSSRKSAMKYKLSIDEYIKNRKYTDIKTLVAFSQEVTDEDLWPGKKYTEGNVNKFPGSEIPERFKTDEYQVLIVAEKYQTGFDQPLLCAMYVDKKLADINAVQTLSRLNRTYNRDGHEKTAQMVYVLDFANDPSDIEAAFKKYYKKAQLAEGTDPDQIHDLQSKIDAYGIYDVSDIERYVAAHYDAVRANREQQRQTTLKAALDPVVERWNQRIKDAKKAGEEEEVQRALIFRHNLAQFGRAYSFLSQIYNYQDTDLEKRALFYAGLVRLLHNPKDDVPLDLSAVKLAYVKHTQRKEKGIKLSEGAGDKLTPAQVGEAKPHPKQYGALAEVIDLLNTLHAPDATEDDRIAFVTILDDGLRANKTLEAQARNNNEEQFAKAGDFPGIHDEAVVDAKDQIEREHDRRNAALAQLLDALLSDKEAMDKFRAANAKRIHQYFNRLPPT